MTITSPRSVSLAVDLPSGEWLDGHLARTSTRLQARARAAKMVHDGVEGARLDGAHPLTESLHRHLADQCRRDGVDPSVGIATARELEYVYSEILREQMPARNALQYIPVDTSVPLGARTYTIRRIYAAGRPAVHRAGQPVPTVSVGKDEHTQRVQHYVLGDQYDIFEVQAGDVAAISRVAEGLRAMRDIMADFANQATWFGIESAGIYGAVTYPWVPKYVEATPFSPAATADDMLQALNRIARYPSNTHRDVGAPNVMFMSHRIRNIIQDRRFTDGSGDTVLSAFLKSTNITQVIGVEEFAQTGFGGSDIIFVTRLDRLGVANVIPQGFTPLPLFERGFDREQVAYMAHGGVLMRDPIHSLVAYVSVTL
jgi:hypothetical protein